MGRSILKTLIALSALLTLTVGCQSSSEDAVVAEVVPAAEPVKKLYVASGSCYSGSGITTYSTSADSSRAITAWDAETGQMDRVMVDFNIVASTAAGTAPQALINKDDHLLVLLENAVSTGDRKVIKLMKSPLSSDLTTYANDTSAFTNTAAHITRGFDEDIDGSLLFSKSVAVEKLSALGVRVVKGGSLPWVNPAGATGNCATATATLIRDIEVLAPYSTASLGKVLYVHAGATAAVNRIAVTQRTGLLTTVGADCAGASAAGGVIATAHTNAPNVVGPTAFVATGPSITSMVYIPTPSPATTTGKLIVSYSASVNTQYENLSTSLIYGIVMWNITETSDTVVTIDTPVVLWSDHTIVYAPSAMAYDSEDNSLYVAVGGSPGVINQMSMNVGYNIEKFTLDIATPSLTRVSTNNEPYFVGNAYTKCISDIKIGEEEAEY